MRKDCKVCKRVFITEADFLTHSFRWRKCDQGKLWFNCSCGSTLVLNPGEFNWYSPTLGMSEKAIDVFRKLAKPESIPHISSTVMEIGRMISDDKVSDLQISKKMREEPVLAAEVLYFANNLQPLDCAPINSIHHAITYVGRPMVSDLVLTAGINRFSVKTKDFKVKDFWFESFIKAQIAEQLMERCDLTLDRDQVYLGSALANIGKLVGALCIPTETDEVNRHVKNKMTTWSEAESRVGTFDHSTLGEIGAAIWGLPEPIADGIRQHHKPCLEIANKPIQLFEVIAFAVQLGHWVSLEPSRIDGRIFSGYVRRFGFTDQSLEQWVQSISYKIRTFPNVA